MANELSCADWDPKTLHSPTVKPEHLLPRENPKEDEPLAKGIPPAVEVPVTLKSRKDCFVDDTVSVFLDTLENLKRELHTTPLAVHVMSRLHAWDLEEPVFRKPLLAPNKLMAEGRPAEVQIVLGWSLDARRLLVSLPEDKFRAWSLYLNGALEKGDVTGAVLESLISRLNHTSHLAPLSRHFLNHLQERTKDRPRSSR